VAEIVGWERADWMVGAGPLAIVFNEEALTA
jgi:hypothetical protein